MKMRKVVVLLLLAGVLLLSVGVFFARLGNAEPRCMIEPWFCGPEPVIVRAIPYFVGLAYGGIASVILAIILSVVRLLSRR